MPWFTAQAREDNPRHARVAIDKPIGSDWAPDWIADFTGQQPAREFIAAIDALGELDEITLEINSPGGDVASGVRIYHYLRDHSAKVSVRVTGMAASIATIIMMAGDTRSMAIGSTMMTHRASALLMGAYNVAEMQELAQNLSRVDASLVEIYAAATGKDKEEIESLLDEGDTYLTAEEAMEWGFATEADEQLRAVACADPRLFMRQLQQSAEIAQLKAQLPGSQAPTAMTAAEALALAFDLTPEQAEAQAADLGDQIIALRQQVPVSSEGAAVALIAKALHLDPQYVAGNPLKAVNAINDLHAEAALMPDMTEAGLRENYPDLVARIEASALAGAPQAGEEAAAERSRITAIVKACQTTGQSQLLEKLVANGMPEEQASEYIYDVAAASGNRHSIHNAHSPEGGHRAGIDHQKIYARLNRKARA